MSLDVQTQTWYADKYVRFSDWRNIGRVDWATNVPVAQFYGGGNPKSFRGLINTDSIKVNDVIGIDYYSMMIPPVVHIGKDSLGRNLFKYMLPPEFYDRYGDSLMGGKVIKLGRSAK